MNNDPVVSSLSQFTELAQKGFIYTVILVGLVGFAFWTGRVIKSLIKSQRDRSRKKDRPDTRHDPAKWEKEWQQQHTADIRRQKTVSVSDQAQHKQQLADRREVYRSTRRANQWKK